MFQLSLTDKMVIKQKKKAPKKATILRSEGRDKENTGFKISKWQGMSERD